MQGVFGTIVQGAFGTIVQGAFWHNCAGCFLAQLCKVLLAQLSRVLLAQSCRVILAGFCAENWVNFLHKIRRKIWTRFSAKNVPIFAKDCLLFCSILMPLSQSPSDYS